MTTTATPTDELCALVVLDDEGRVVSATPPAAALIGCPLDTLPGTSFASRFLEGGLPAPLTALPQGRTWTATVRRANDSTFEAELTVVRPGAGAAGLTLVLRIPGEARRSSETLYRALFDRSPIPKWLYDIDYTDDESLRAGVADDRIAFLQKPFTPDSLAQKVREVLDEGRSGGV